MMLQGCNKQLGGMGRGEFTKSMIVKYIDGINLQKINV